MRVSPNVDCSEFQTFVFHFQAGQLPEPDQQRLQDHVNGCPACADVLEFENAFLDVLQRRVRPTPAPPELKLRIREALAERAPERPGWSFAWLLRPGFAATIASLVLVLLLVGPWSPFAPVASGDGRTRAGSLRVETTATLVDVDCDQAGLTYAQQQACRNGRHVNGLKVADNKYWHLISAQAAARELMLDRRRRGERVRVEGELFTEISTLYLTAARPAGRMAL